MDLATFKDIVGIRPSPRLFVAYDIYRTFKHRPSFQRSEAMGVHPKRKLVERSIQGLVLAGLAEKSGVQYRIV